MSVPAKLILQDCLLALRTMSDDSIDSLVTDPPAGIGFMGKAWDDDKGGRKQWIEWMTEVMRECHRVLKPGAHGLVWALPRTSHWTATALEDAGFEVRDVVTHLFGSGFPKSLDVSKAIDKQAGAEREVLSKKLHRNHSSSGGILNRSENPRFETITKPSTHAAKKWQGWGTALKPASEHWILVRKPCSEKTVAANVLKWGTGALNIDASRISGEIQGGHRMGPKPNGNGVTHGEMQRIVPYDSTQGRFPANLVFSHTPYCTDEACDLECAVMALDEQSGMLKSGAIKAGQSQGTNFRQSHSRTAQYDKLADSGGASRFFYCAKISKAERNAGLEGIEARRAPLGDDRPSGGRMSRLDGRPERLQQNTHPTVKPKRLMSYLIRMITPPGGSVLDPFMGSGSTGCAARKEGFQFVGIEKEPEYFNIASKRIEAHE